MHPSAGETLVQKAFELKLAVFIQNQVRGHQWPLYLALQLEFRRKSVSVKHQHHPVRAVGILLRTRVAGAGRVGVQPTLGDHF